MDKWTCIWTFLAIKRRASKTDDNFTRKRQIWLFNHNDA